MNVFQIFIFFMIIQTGNCRRRFVRNRFMKGRFFSFHRAKTATPPTFSQETKSIKQKSKEILEVCNIQLCRKCDKLSVYQSRNIKLNNIKKTCTLMLEMNNCCPKRRIFQNFE